MSDITYLENPGMTPIGVYLEGKLVGHIKEVRNGEHRMGYAYYPKGSRTAGETLPTVLEVKATLEEM